MSRFSGMSADTRNKAIAVAVFVVVAAGIVYYELFAGGTPNPAASALPVATAPAANAPSVAPGQSDTGADTARATVATGTGASRAGSSSATLDPALRMDAMLVAEQIQYSGVGRNIFSPNSAPPITIPKPIAPARPIAVAPLPPVRTGPPALPAIELTFFGTMTDAAGKRQAMLMHQNAVYTAQAGDIVLRRYRIVSIDARSIQVEDLLTSSKQTLPLVAN